MYKGILALAVSCLLLIVPIAYAEIAGANISVGGSERATGTTADSYTIEGGNVSEVNVSGITVTGRWAGFYGNISGGIILGDASDNKFFEWTVSDVTGAVVYATNGTTSFSNVAPATVADLPSFVGVNGADNYSNTFNNTGTFSNSSQLGSVGSVDFAGSWQNGIYSTDLATWSLYDSTDEVYIMAGVAVDDAVSFRNTEVDYQLIAPANSGGQQYFFYLELP